MKKEISKQYCALLASRRNMTNEDIRKLQRYEDFQARVCAHTGKHFKDFLDHVKQTDVSLKDALEHFARFGKLPGSFTEVLAGKIFGYKQIPLR